MTVRLAATIGGAFALATLAAVVVPQLGEVSGEVPGLETLLATGALVGLLTTAALYVVLRRELGLPATVALLAVGYNALVVLVKFVLGPRGLYEASDEGRFESWFDPSDEAEALIIAGGLFALYAATLTVIFLVCRRRLRERRPLRVRRVVVTVAAAVLVATGGLPLVLLLGGLDYAGFVLSSGVSLLVTAALAAAVTLAALAFRSTAERAQLLGDAALLVSVFWIGLAFLALYQALWVVYVLVLTSIWPLRVITPK